MNTKLNKSAVQRMKFLCFLLISTFSVMIIGVIFTSGLILPAVSAENGDTAITVQSKETVKKLERMAHTREGLISDICGNPVTYVLEDGSVLCSDTDAYGFLAGYVTPDFDDLTVTGYSYGLRYKLSDYLFRDCGEGNGCDIRLTIDGGLQKYCTTLLRSRGYTGSVIVMDNSTGALRCFASVDAAGPFDVNGFSGIEEWNNTPGYWIRKGDGDCTDAPGSTFKVITSCAAIEAGLKDFTYEDDGTYRCGELEINNALGYSYGKLDMERALSRSVNTYYAALGTAVGTARMQDMANRFLLGTDIPLDFTTVTTSFSADGPESLALASFGQGNTEVSPLYMCMVAGTIANGGKMLRPYMIDEITNSKNGKIMYSGHKEILTEPVSKSTAKKVASYMKTTAEYYGFEKDGKYTVHCKTGTAELTGSNKTYIICFTDEYSFVIARNKTVNGEFGSQLVPMAEAVLDYLYM